MKPEDKAVELELNAQVVGAAGGKSAGILLQAAEEWRKAGRAKEASIAAQAAALRPDATKEEKEAAKAFSKPEPEEKPATAATTEEKPKRAASSKA